MSSTSSTIRLKLRKPHPAQKQVTNEAERFNVVCAGRRFGKTDCAISRSAETMLAGKRVGFFAPSYKVLAECWRDVTRVLRPVMTRHNDTEHRIEIMTGGSLEMWTLQDKDAGRSRFYDRVLLDEVAMVPDLLAIWNEAIRATLLQTGGDAWIFSTPKGRNDFQTMWLWGQPGAKHADGWHSWRFPSEANPYLPVEEIEAMRLTMPLRAFEQEVLARFIDEVTGALFRMADIESARVAQAPELSAVVVGVDPAGSTSRESDETGIVAVGVDRQHPPHAYVLADVSGTYTPDGWARRAIDLYHDYRADKIVAEKNYGGDMVKHTLKTVDASVPVKVITASRGKAIRAEPVAAACEQGRLHFVGRHDELELQMTTWSPMEDSYSPDRLDALVHACAQTLLSQAAQWNVADIARMGAIWRGEVIANEPAVDATFDIRPEDFVDATGQRGPEGETEEARARRAEIAEMNARALTRARGL